jgi:hypothetical protein
VIMPDDLSWIRWRRGRPQRLLELLTLDMAGVQFQHTLGRLLRFPEAPEVTQD